MALRVVVEGNNVMDFIPVDDGKEIAEGVKVVHTPGHTLGHASLIVNSEVRCKEYSLKSRIALAGDAIVSLSYFDKGKVWAYNKDFYSKEAGIDSMEKLAKIYDVIIPGHGTPCLTFIPKWMED